MGRRTRTGILIGLAVVVSLALLTGLTLQAVAAQPSCDNSPLVLNVAVSADLAPAIAQVARDFSNQHHSADGRCVRVQVSGQSSAAVAARLDGQGASASLARVDAWIPDSSLWIDVARTFPQGARNVQPTGAQVAQSPLMTVMPMAVARQTGLFRSPAGWNVLLPAAEGGPPAALGLKVAIPDPTQSAAGLATLVEVSRLLGPGPSSRVAFTSFALGAQPTQQFTSPASLASFVSTAAPPWFGREITVASEQAVIAYDRANPGQPLAAQYPTGLAARLGTAVLDYPYVLTTSDPARRAAAREFEQSLRQQYAASLIRFAGFRTPDGRADTTAPSFGLQAQLLQEAPGATASDAQTSLEIWSKLEPSSRLLVLLDTSRSMGAHAGTGAQTLAGEVAPASVLDVALLPDSTQIGLWEMADDISGAQPYQSLVPVGPLPAELGAVTRRQQLQQIDGALRPDGKPLKLNDAILAGYQAMTAAYQSDSQNVLIVITAGVDDAPGDMPAADLVAQLRRMFNPRRSVKIRIDQIGTAGDFAELQQIAQATGGSADELSDPAQVGQLFLAGLAGPAPAPG
ncbi:MAG: substrate-binding domain-containing protein [Streptosporangiaceae bacterium]